MPTKPQLVSERILPEQGAFDVAAMARGEPGLPASFVWRGQRYHVSRLLTTRRATGEDRGDTYVRRHYFDIETSDALQMTIYFERNPGRARERAWWLFTLSPPEPIMETDRLALRRWTYADRAIFRQMVAEPAVMRHLHQLRPMSESEADEALANTITRYEVGYGDWAVVLKSSGEVTGESGLTPVEGGEVEIGWMLLSAFWGCGYAFEAAAAVKNYAFKTIGLGQLVAFVRPDNDRSRHLAEKLGMKLVGGFINANGQEMLRYTIQG
jgi:RimJ/RimL family protein N-acetyltransferase